MSIIENYRFIQQQIADLSSKFRRKKEDILLLPVSKMHPVSAILELYQYGVRDFGENKVQEMVEKASQLPSDIRWHLIGQLQTNKVKYMASFVHLIHSVDRVVLVDEIEKQAKKVGRIQSILIQVKVSTEDIKAGIELGELTTFIEYVKKNPHLHLSGFMTMTSLTNDMNQRKRELAQFFQSIDAYRLSEKIILSAGMSDDFPLAVEMGSNLIRVGSAIFGQRSY